MLLLPLPTLPFICMYWYMADGGAAKLLGGADLLLTDMLTERLLWRRLTCRPLSGEPSGLTRNLFVFTNNEPEFPAMKGTIVVVLIVVLSVVVFAGTVEVDALVVLVDELDDVVVVALMVVVVALMVVVVALMVVVGDVLLTVMMFAPKALAPAESATLAVKLSAPMAFASTGMVKPTEFAASALETLALKIMLPVFVLLTWKL
jgi:hypothetical protein